MDFSQIVIAFGFWLLPGPVVGEWVIVSGRKVRLRLNPAPWLRSLAARVRKGVKKLQRGKHERETELLWVTTTQTCPGECGRTIGSGWIRYEMEWVRFLVEPHSCHDCAQKTLFRFLAAIPEKQVRISRTLREGDILDFRAVIGSNRIVDGKGRQVAVIVDPDPDSRAA